MFRSVYGWLFPVPTARQVAEASLKQAETALLTAEHFAEAYQSEAIMLQGRIERLRRYLDAQGSVAKTPTPIRKAAG